jgi:hypothetical protein
VRLAQVVNEAAGSPEPGEAELRAVVADARAVRDAAGVDVGFAIRAIPRANDTRVVIGVVTPAGERADERLAFQRGAQGADRAAIAGAAVLLENLREGERTG